MRFIRLTYFQIPVISLVFAAFLVQVFVSFSGSAKKASFTSWLDRNMVEAKGQKDLILKSELRELPERAENFNTFIELASRLVLENRSNFQLPGDQEEPEKKDQDKDFETWLLSQWTAFHDHMSRKEAVLIETQKLLPRWLSQVLEFGNTVISKTLSLFSESAGNRLISTSITQAFPIPLISGISINAP